jgi:hypothetical protein
MLSSSDHVIHFTRIHENMLGGMSSIGTTASGLLCHAQEFLDAAQRISRPPLSGRLAQYYLLGHGCELALKAFLLSRGVSLSCLKSRKFGHNIGVLITKSANRGLNPDSFLSISDLQIIGSLSEDYMNKRFEYLEYGRTYRVKRIAVVLAATQHLVQAVRAKLAAHAA